SARATPRALSPPPPPVQSRPMHKAVLPGCATVILWAALAVPAAHGQPKTFEYSGRGEWAQVSNATTQVASDPTLDRVEDLLRKNQNKSAEKLALQWVLGHKGNPQRDRGLFLIAQALYQYGDRIKAFYYLDELMDEYSD